MTETLTLERHPSEDYGTFGVLTRYGKQIAVTCELPWRDNLPDVSCIPCGTYTFTRYDSPTKGEVWITQDVPSRKDIEIHTGNTIRDTKGCILVGDTFGIVGRQHAVINSRDTMDSLLDDLPDTFRLAIIWGDF